MKISEFCANVFEPKAATLFSDQSNLMTVGEASLLSMAISQKRIADVLTGMGDTAILTNLVQQLAWEAGRSFQHGTRTDR